MRQLAGILLTLFVLVALLSELSDAQRTRTRRPGGRGRGRNRKEQCHGKELDKCLEPAQQLTRGEHPSRIIKDEEGVNKICNTVENAMKCFQGYMKKCGTPLQRELFEFATEYFTKTVEQFCQPGELKTNFLRHSPCINDNVLESAEYRTKCVNRYLAAVDLIGNRTTMDERLDTICCSHTTWESCALDMIETKCSADSRAAFVTFNEKAFGGLSAMLCPLEVFNPASTTCTAALPPANAKPKGKFSDNPVAKYISTYFAFLFQA